MQDDQDPGGMISALDSHILRSAFKTSIAELQLPAAKWVEHATAMMRELTGNRHVDTGIIELIITQGKPPAAAEFTNDNDRPEDHLAAVTLGLHATLKGLAAPVELLVEALTFDAPVDVIKP